MKKINVQKEKTINNCIKKYYDLNDIYISVINNYIDEDKTHKHEIADQIIFVISGTSRISSENNEIVITDNEFVHIPAGEFHKVESVTEETKMLVLKYKSSNENIVQILKEDYTRKTCI